MTEAKPRRCVDCLAEGLENKRPADYPGPRCYTHNLAKKKQRKAAARARRWENVYSITAEQYQAIYEAQGCKCAICQRSTGASKFLSVDHDHACCPGPVSCGRCVRSILCSPCNVFLGWIRDDVEAAKRLVEYLSGNAPGRKVLDNWNVL